MSGASRQSLAGVLQVHSRGRQLVFCLRRLVRFCGCNNGTSCIARVHLPPQTAVQKITRSGQACLPAFRSNSLSQPPHSCCCVAPSSPLCMSAVLLRLINPKMCTGQPCITTWVFVSCMCPIPTLKHALHICMLIRMAVFAADSKMILQLVVLSA